MIKLSQLLLEGIKETSALEYLQNLVLDSPFKGRVFLAGGAVRDMQIGKDYNDLDVVVTGDINAGIEFAKWAARKMNNYREGSNPVVYPKYGTAKFTLSGVTYNGIDLSDVDVEAVATRKEKYSGGSRKPEVSSGDLQDDANRRDFTINSLLKDLTTGEILDLTGKGIDDIKNGIVRTALDPNVIFSEDPLRMIRAVRFAFKYDWDLPMFMIKALKQNASQLQRISSERISEELNKILLTASPDRALKLLRITGLLDYIIPEFKDAYKMTQNSHHTKDVFGHTLDVLKSTQPILVRRLIALFHDIGKTATRSVTPTGIHFYGHEDVGAEMARKIMFRLRYPKDLINAVETGVKNHMSLKHGGDDAVNISDKTLRKFKIALGDNLEHILDVIHADNTAHASQSSMPNQIDNIRKRLDALKDEMPTQKKLPINGNDLISIGMKRGKIFTKIFDAVAEKWYDNPNMTKEEALDIARQVYSQGL